ncbi:MAG: hypothetical protein IPK17_17025 [Chloroflexi bacterium]|uniref:hypothetical protein n=1 Tax=Candidatus Flexifilum breve TaxID=3140694 RepID=UPI003136BAED|nr:hypothetical protein [Chloroflexota bacterium]
MRRVLGGFLKLITALVLVGVIVVSIRGGSQTGDPVVVATASPILATATLSLVDLRQPTRELLTVEAGVVPVAVDITKLTLATSTPIPIYTRPITRLVTLTPTLTNTRIRPSSTATLEPTGVEPTAESAEPTTAPTNQPPPPTNTPVPPTAVPPTATPIPPSPVPSTSTPIPPTAVPPTNTPPPTPVPPTETPVPTATNPPLRPPILETLLPPLFSPPEEPTEEACSDCAGD